MFNSTSPSSTRPTLSSSSPSSSSCTLNSSNHASKPPIIAPPSAHDLPAHTHPHPALVIPLSHCHHLHLHPNLDSPHHLYPPPRVDPISANLSNNASGRSRIVNESFGSHSFSTDPHCYTTDCSPRSVIRHIHSSTSSGPSPDPGRPSSYSPRCISNLRANSHNLAATCSSIASGVPHCPALHAGASPASLLSIQSQQSMMQSHLHRYPPWSSPAAIHHQCLDASSRSFSASSERSYTTADTLEQATSYVHCEAEIEEGNNQHIRIGRSSKSVRNGSPKSIDMQRERLFRPGYSSRSPAVDKPCVNAESKEGDGKQAAAMEALLRSDTESEYGSNAHPHGYPRAPISLSDSSFDIVQLKGVDRQRIHENRSYSCNLHTTERVSRSSSRQSCSAILHQAHKATMAPKSPDSLLGYVDGSYHDQHPTSRGSKWEDAEKWLTPANYNHNYRHQHQHHQHQQHHPTGCRGLIPSLGLLRMSDCINAHGTAIEPVHFPNPRPANASYSADYLSAHAHCTLSATMANYMNHSLHAPFDAASLQNDCSSAQEQANTVVNHPSRQFVYVNCIHPQLMSCNSNIPYARQCSPAPHGLGDSDQGIIRGQVSRQWNTTPPQLQAEDTSQLNPDSSGSGMVKSNASSELKHKNLRSSIKEAVPCLNERRMPPLPPPGSVHHHHHQRISSQLTGLQVEFRCHILLSSSMRKLAIRIYWWGQICKEV